MNVGIYYLIVRNIDTNEKIQIELTDRKENRYCTTLGQIDKLTTKFYSKDQLIKRLYDNKYINFQNADVYIEYSHNGLRFEEVLFKDMESITKLPTVSDSTFDINDKKFINAADNYIVELNKRTLRNYVMDSPQFNLKFKEHLKKYIDELYYNNVGFNIRNLYKDLSNYKTFRDLYFAINNHIYHKTRQELDELTRLRLNAKLVDLNKQEKQNNIEEKQLEFSINNNEIQLPGQGQPISNIQPEVKQVEESQPEIKEKPEEKQLEFDIYKNEINLPNPNQVISPSELEKTIREHNEEKEEFLTEDDWNQNYYPYNVKK